MAEVPDQLPEAHPRFTTHFTNPIYDPDDASNDEVAPFGTDEGFDELHDWAQQLDDLRAHPTLRHMLGDDADEQINDLRHSQQVDVDDIIIGLGFTLLRSTGQIDAEGHTWLVEALQRQDQRGSGPEYSQMLSDLDQLQQPLDPRLTPRPIGKTPKSWLSITGSNDEDLEAWYQRTARGLATDPAWTAWWQSSGLHRLVLHPSVIGPPGQDHTTYHRNKSWLQVVGSSAELSKHSWTILETDDDNPDAPASGFHTPEGPALMRALTYRLLKESGEYLGLGPPPEHMPV